MLNVLVPDEAIVYSAGVGHDVSFDIELSRIGLKALRLIDPTPGVFESASVGIFVKESGNISTHRVALSGHDGEVLMWPPERENHVSHSAVSQSHRSPITVPSQRLTSIMAEVGDEKIDILKMDIEGSEYEVIDDLARSDIRPGQVIVEFHHRMTSIGAARTTAAVNALREMGYGVIGVSDTCQEVTFALRQLLATDC